MIKKLVGKKTDKKEKLSTSYSLYDTCDKCPLTVYIDLICNNNLNALLIQGNAPEEVLISTRIDLVVEFSELSGNQQTQSLNSVIKQIYYYRNKIRGLSICLELIYNDSYASSIPYLNNEFRTKEPQSEQEFDRLIKTVQARIKGHMVKLITLEKRFTALSEENDNGKITPQYFNEQLVMLSKYLGFTLNKNKLNVAEYAAYLKDFKLNYKGNGKH